MFNSEHDIHTLYENAVKRLPHHCNDSCLVNNPDGTLRCKELDNIIIIKDNTKHNFLSLPNNDSVGCLQIPQCIGLTDKIDINDDKNILDFKSSLTVFHPSWHVPPTKPTNNVNISPLEGYIFQ